MFNYENLSAEKIAMLEAEDADVLAAAGLMVIHGMRKGILSQAQAIPQLHNLFLAITA